MNRLTVRSHTLRGIASAKIRGVHGRRRHGGDDERRGASGSHSPASLGLRARSPNQHHCAAGSADRKEKGKRRQQAARTPSYGRLQAERARRDNELKRDATIPSLRCRDHRRQYRGNKRGGGYQRRLRHRPLSPGTTNWQKQPQRFRPTPGNKRLLPRSLTTSWSTLAPSRSTSPT